MSLNIPTLRCILISEQYHHGDHITEEAIILAHVPEDPQIMCGKKFEKIS
jgi:hypothetical protein